MQTKTKEFLFKYRAVIIGFLLIVLMYAWFRVGKIQGARELADLIETYCSCQCVAP